MLIDEKIDSLQKFAKEKVTQEEIAKILGITKSAVSNRIARKQELKDFEILKLDDAFINKANERVQQIQDKWNEKLLQDTNSFITLDYYSDVFGSCGNGVFQFSEKKEQITVPQNAFFKKFSPVKKYFVINAYGNSMEPVFYDKDKLIVQQWEGEQIIDNRPYLFAYKDEIFIKRLAKNVDQLMIIPENKEYDVRKLEGKQLEDVNIIGLVVGLMRDLR